MITSVFAVSFSPAIAQAIVIESDTNCLPPEIFFAIPTYLVASLFYPMNRVEPIPEQSFRFPRRHNLYLARVIATYGRLFDTPYNAIRYMKDVLRC
jgi:hypothetical protein